MLMLGEVVLLPSLILTKAHPDAAQPLSDDARERTAAAFADALKSVFVSSIKLAAFHALFTWLTFRWLAQRILGPRTLA